MLFDMKFDEILGWGEGDEVNWFEDDGVNWFEDDDGPSSCTGSACEPWWAKDPLAFDGSNTDMALKWGQPWFSNLAMLQVWLAW